MSLQAVKNGGSAISPCADGDPNEIYYIVDEITSRLSHDAEIEHCLDWVRAHLITLKAAEKTIRHALPGLQNNRYPSLEDATKGALKAFVGHAPHARIAAVFKASFHATAGLGIEFQPQTFADALLRLFIDVGEQTRERDANLWHMLRVGGPIPFDELPRGAQLGATLLKRRYHKMVRDPRFAVNVHSSETVIQL